MWSTRALPQAGAIDYYDAIEDSKDGERLAQLRPLVEVRYKKHTASEGDLRNLPASKALQKLEAGSLLAERRAENRAALLDAYTGETKPLGELKNKIISAQPIGVRDLCPYCGCGMPDSFDHILPKSIYPEYSVHPRNLVRACTDCQRRRPASLWRETILLYFDTLDEGAAAVDADVDFSQDPPRVSFSWNSGVPNSGPVARLKKHCNRLDLFRRWENRATDYFFVKLDSIRSAYEIRRRVDELETELMRDWLNCEAHYGANHWETALWAALANTAQDLVDYIEATP